MDPSVVRGDMSGYGGIPQGLIGVPPTPMYTPYGQPLTPYVFGHGHVGPRGDGLGASPINPTGRPRFPGHSPYGSQSYSKGLNPRVPWVPPMGFPRGPPPGFPPRYSQVFPGRGGSVDIPEGRGVVYGTGEGHRSPDGVGVPRESRDAFSHEDMIPEGPEEDLVSSEEEGSQDEGEQGPVVPEGGIVAITPDVGQGLGGIIPNNGVPIDPDDQEPDDGVPLDPNNQESDNEISIDPEDQEPANEAPIDPDNKRSDNERPIDPDDPRAEIEILRQQLAQAQAALAKSNQALQKRTAHENQIKNLRELVKKQKERFDSEFCDLQAKEKEREEEHFQASLERQKAWEQKRSREQVKWAEQQQAWEQERKKEQAEWVEQKREWEEKSHRELREKERAWNEEMEKQRLEWERVQQQERKANKEDLDKVRKDLGDQVKQVVRTQQEQQQTANALLRENQRLMERVTQLVDYNEELEEKVKRVTPARQPQREGAHPVNTTPGSPNGSIVRPKATGANYVPSPVIDAQPLDGRPAPKFQFTNPGGVATMVATQNRGRGHPGPRDDLSDAGSEMSGGTIRRGIQIIKNHAPHNVYQPTGRGQPGGTGRGHPAAATNAMPIRGVGKGADGVQSGNRTMGGYPRNYGRQRGGYYPFDQASHAEGDVSIPSVYSDHDLDQFSEGTQAPEVNDYHQGPRESLGSNASQGSRRRNGGQPPYLNLGHHREQPPYQRGRGNNFGGYQLRANDRDNFRSFKDPKLSKYDGKIPWRAYEVKLMLMARKYDWDDNTKLAKLVEALDDKALTFFSNLAPEVQGNFEVVRRKMNNRFIPREPATTVRKQLQTIQQKAEEALEEWAERCQQCAYDAWGEMSEDVAELAAVEAFLGGVLETEAAFSVMEKDPHTIDEALELLKKAVHSRKSLSCRLRNTQRTARTVSFASDSATAEVRTTSVVNTPPQPESTAPNPKVEAELKDLRSSMTETQGQVAKILELLTTQNVQRGRAHSRSPSPSPNGPCYQCMEPGHIARNCPKRSRSPSPSPRGESFQKQENQ